jgi:hypothetical protein
LVSTPPRPLALRVASRPRPLAAARLAASRLVAATVDFSGLVALTATARLGLARGT